MITEEHIQEFKNTGVVVIENVLTEEEVQLARDSLHAQLRGLGVDHDKILSGEQDPGENTRLKGKASRIFYSKWKMDVQLNPKVHDAMNTLMQQTFGISAKAVARGSDPDFAHPFERFDEVLAYVDHVCWRLPDSILAEGGLGLHLDRNPVDPYLEAAGGLKKWRPIQATLVLTDHYGSESGGIRVVKGFHKRIDDYFSRDDYQNSDLIGQGGEFFRMHPNKFGGLVKECQPVNAPRGSLICWDNRLPHATCDRLSGWDTREVVYIGYIPNVEVNRKYIKDQLKAIQNNTPPPAYVGSDPKEKVDRDWDDSDLTEKQRDLLGFNLESNKRKY